MATAPQIHALLRFLSQDAKIPLATAMSKVKELQKAKLNSPDEVSKADPEMIQAIFPEEKLAKQVLNAAKKTCKKRKAPGDEGVGSLPKKTKKLSVGDEKTPFKVESSLALPEIPAEEEDIATTTLLTNRAPLVLAFAVVVLKYTMPEQPLSSRLSLAQTVVSANSRTKAVSLGLHQGKTVEDEGWGEGQPTIKIMGREIKVLKRWGYDWREGAPDGSSTGDTDGIPREGKGDANGPNEPPALWGLDLDALGKSNNHRLISGRPAENNGLPIHTADSARTYLLKSFSNASDAGVSNTSKKKTFSQITQEKEDCLGLLLRAIDLLCKSWASTLNADELDRRAWSWYLHVRPEVQSGPAGWGEKGRVELSKILNLRRSA